MKRKAPGSPEYRFLCSPKQARRKAENKKTADVTYDDLVICLERLLGFYCSVDPNNLEVLSDRSDSLYQMLDCLARIGSRVKCADNRFYWLSRPDSFKDRRPSFA